MKPQTSISATRNPGPWNAPNRTCTRFAGSASASIGTRATASVSAGSTARTGPGSRQ